MNRFEHKGKEPDILYFLVFDVLSAVKFLFSFLLSFATDIRNPPFVPAFIKDPYEIDSRVLTSADRRVHEKMVCKWCEFLSSYASVAL